MSENDEKKLGGVLEAVGLAPTGEQLFDEEIAAQCDRCRIKELEPKGLGAHRFIQGHRCWLCDRCWAEVRAGA